MRNATIIGTILLMTSCNTDTNQLASDDKTPLAAADSAVKAPEEKFDYIVEQFADLRILRYRVPGFDELPLKTKELLYYLSEAALCGRDITWDQNYKYNLTIRKLLESIVSNYTGSTAEPEFEKLMVYAKRVWFSNG
ncbi:MAG: hypothetical protein ACXVPQ_08385, partial [Bacteroidia bacterium]